MVFLAVFSRISPFFQKLDVLLSKVIGKEGNMSKYNITEIKEKKADYRSLVNPHMMDEMQEKIMKIIVIDKKYRDQDYSAKKLAEDIGTNTRYVSAVVNTRFHCNFTSFVNKYRIDDAMSLLVDKRYQDLNVEDVGMMVGFSNRQSFYASFYRILGITPREYRIKHMKPSKKKKVIQKDLFEDLSE